MIEAVLAMLMLAGGFGALLTLSTGESRRVDITRQRLLAAQALRQLREALAPALVEDLSQFPATLAAFEANGLLGSSIAELPGIAIPEDPRRAALATAFEEALAAEGVKRAVLYQAAADGGASGVLGVATYVVRYPGPDGRDRTLEFKRVVAEY